MKDKDSPPYETTGKIVVLFVLIFIYQNAHLN